MQKLFAPRKIIFFIALLLALAIATPALADYLGPNRTVTTTVSVCHMVKYECKEVNGNWKYKRTEDWSCPTGHDACEDGGGACNASDHTGSYCAREEELKEVTTTYPSATIVGSIQNCTLQNGWCNRSTVPELALSANEPLSGYNITLIEGTRNGASFACDSTVASCNVPLSEGDNTLTYWALSSWGDSSEMGTSFAKVDTIPPDVTMSIAGTAGDNGWYTLRSRSRQSQGMLPPDQESPPWTWRRMEEPIRPIRLRSPSRMAFIRSSSKPPTTPGIFSKVRCRMSMWIRSRPGWICRQLGI